MQDLHAALVIFAADLGQADAPRRAVQQAHAERVFQRLDVLADRRGRDVHPARRCGEPVTLGDPYKSSDAGEAVHVTSDYSEHVNSAFVRWRLIQRHPRLILSRETDLTALW